MKFLTLLLISLVLLSSVDAYRRRKSKQCNSGAEEKVKRNYHWDLQTQERIEKENLETEEIRKNNPEGPNKFKEATEYTLEVRIVDTTTGTEEDFEEKQVKLNNIGTVFIYENHNDIISVTNSLSLHDVTNEADKIDQGICCGGVSDIQSGLHIHSSSSSDTNISSSTPYSCLTINAKNQIWNVCSTSESEVQNFKSDIKTWIVEDWFKAHDLPQPVTIPETPSVQIGIFTIDDQDYWPSTCQGLYQSPININNQDAEEGSVYESVKFDYQTTNGQLQWNEQNFVVSGDFGNFVHTWEYGQREYQAQSLVFKFPSEHTLNGEQLQGELQVSHQSADGKTLVLSFFLTEDGTGTEGKFFTELNVDIWEQDSQQAPQLKSLNLNEILADGKSANVDLNKSYYHYRGSLTSPPCTEGIEHFVLENPIYVPKQTLESFKSKVVKIGSSHNNRNVNTKFSDLVLYTKQIDECAQGIPDSIKDLLEEKKRQLDRKSSQEAAEQEEDDNQTENSNEPQTQIDGHIIKTTEDVVELKYETAETPEEAEEEGVDLSNLDSTEKAELRNGGTIQGDFDIPEEQIQEQTNQSENDEEAAEEEVPSAEEQINQLAQDSTAAVPELHPSKKHRMKKLMRQRK